MPERETDTASVPAATDETRFRRRSSESTERDACPYEGSTERLRTFLLNEQYDIDDDPELARHLAEGCKKCEIEKQIIFATDRNVREKYAPSVFQILSFGPREKPVGAPEHAPEEQEVGDFETLAKDVASDLAVLLKTPAPPFSLSDLVRMADNVRMCASAESALMEAARVADCCEKRYERLGRELKDVAVEAAGELISAVKREQPKQKHWQPAQGSDATRDPRQYSAIPLEGENGEDNQLRLQREEEAVLTYLMGTEWFVNRGAERVWEVSEGRLVFFCNDLRAFAQQSAQPSDRGIANGERTNVNICSPASNDGLPIS